MLNSDEQAKEANKTNCGRASFAEKAAGHRGDLPIAVTLRVSVVGYVAIVAGFTKASVNALPLDTVPS